MTALVVRWAEVTLPQEVTAACYVKRTLYKRQTVDSYIFNRTMEADSPFLLATVSLVSALQMGELKCIHIYLNILVSCGSSEYFAMYLSHTTNIILVGECFEVKWKLFETYCSNI